MFPSSRSRLFEFGQFPRKHEIRLEIRATPFPLAVVFLHIIRHLDQRRAGKENFVDAFALHLSGVVVRDRAPAPAENRNVVGAFLLQLANDSRKKIDVTAVVTGKADRTHVLLNGRTDDIPEITMKSEVNDFDSMPDKFEIDGVNGAVVSIADRNRGKNANR